MDQQQYSTFLDALKEVPDPRHARGKRYEWPVLLAILGGAVVSGFRSGRAIAQWAWLHAAEVVAVLQPKRGQVPSASTLYRVLQQVDIEAWEAQITAYTRQLEEQEVTPGERGAGWQGQAIDGKTLRGASKHGEPVQVMSRVRHGSGIVLQQVEVETTTNEVGAVPELLEGEELTGTVITLDALLTQRSVAQQILDQGGEYLMVVKKNQPAMYEAIALLFEESPSQGQTDWDTAMSFEKGHGRLEWRRLESSTALSDYVDWPGVSQVLRRVCRRKVLKKGKTSVETTYGITSLTPQEAGAEQLETFWRGHWTIENGVHYVRDETFGEDRRQIHTGQAPQAWAALCNGLLNLLRTTGWRNIADALRYYGASVTRALHFIGA